MIPFKADIVNNEGESIYEERVKEGEFKFDVLHKLTEEQAEFNESESTVLMSVGL